MRLFSYFTNKVISSNFLKVSISSGFATLIKILASFFVNKLMAVYIGPAGIALAGQLNNFLGVITPFSVAGLNIGITKYVSEYNETDVVRRNQVIIYSGRLMLICSISFGLFISIFCKSISLWLFNSVKYNNVILILGACLPLIASNIWALAIINGLKEYKKFNLINIIINIFGLIVTIFLSMKFGLVGALFSIITTQSIAAIFSLPVLLKHLNPWKLKIYNYDYKVLKLMLKYILMSIITALTIPVVQLFIRKFITTRLSIDEAGYWESLNRISSIHLLLITTTLATYVLPRLSELQDKIQIKKEITHIIKIVTPLVLLSSVFIFLFRSYIIEWLFTSSFRNAEPLFGMQLVGDFFKILSWIFGMFFLAKAKVLIYVTGEILFSVALYFFTIVFVNTWGLVGVTYSYAFLYICYFIYCIMFFKFYNK